MTVSETGTVPQTWVPAALADRLPSRALLGLGRVSWHALSNRLRAGFTIRGYVARVDLNEWISSYGQAWETGDDDLIVSMFSEDASYRSTPFQEPYRGHDEIRAYWLRATGAQRETRVRMGTPFGEGHRVAVEWWTTMVDDGETVTLPGCLLLRFAPDGRCADLREYWHLEPGRHDPFPGWGA